jgi:hypothetical protein
MTFPSLKFSVRKNSEHERGLLPEQIHQLKDMFDKDWHILRTTTFKDWLLSKTGAVSITEELMMTYAFEDTKQLFGYVLLWDNQEKMTMAYLDFFPEFVSVFDIVTLIREE